MRITSATSAAIGTRWSRTPMTMSRALMTGLIEAGHDVTMLTNFASDTFVEARERFPFLQHPRGVTVSGDVGFIKPQREIYDLHVSTFGLAAAGDHLHRRQPRQCRWRERRRLAGSAVPERQNARGGPRASRDRAVTGRSGGPETSVSYCSTTIFSENRLPLFGIMVMA